MYIYIYTRIFGRASRALDSLKLATCNIFWMRGPIKRHGHVPGRSFSAAMVMSSMLWQTSIHKPLFWSTLDMQMRSTPPTSVNASPNEESPQQHILARISFQTPGPRSSPHHATKNVKRAVTSSIGNYWLHHPSPFAMICFD